MQQTGQYLGATSTLVSPETDIEQQADADDDYARQDVRAIHGDIH